MTATFKQRFFLTVVVCLLATAVVCAATEARLSLYKPVVAQSGVMAKSMKLAECRFQKLAPESVTPCYCDFTAELAARPQSLVLPRADAPLPAQPVPAPLRL